jgi:hypothetical protein
MKISINIEDYLSQEEMQEIAKEEFTYAISEKFRSDSDIERIISNLAYNFLFKAVDAAIGTDSFELIKTNVIEVLKDDSNIRYCLWRKKDAWDNYESPAVTILNKAIEDNRELIENRVFEMVSNYDFKEAKDEIYDVVCNAIEKQLFGK